jgi:CheY-like chemotaxis protein
MTKRDFSECVVLINDASKTDRKQIIEELQKIGIKPQFVETDNYDIANTLAWQTKLLKPVQVVITDTRVPVKQSESQDGFKVCKDAKDWSKRMRYPVYTILIANNPADPNIDARIYCDHDSQGLPKTNIDQLAQMIKIGIGKVEREIKKSEPLAR